MALFDPGNRTKNPESAKLYATLEVVYTIVDFAAAGLFIVGSVLFFRESTQIPATWCFLVGSICFALKPTLRLFRELKYAKRDDVGTLAERAEGNG
ncbi:YrhK family protein [Arthrobacter roseus]|uniref:YrhK family protein n=1 Tax=Arthrobacter roseus TaxID=136274 RepID=UPI00196545FB|nr:YrhK family protein [Arthrobacter roseus]MBM7849780.1 glucan phosphoethanolaminetransferase (alkaline phosphatase superfamily) [Arthrobacter roseus]